jgi:hypothetical protein
VRVAGDMRDATTSALIQDYAAAWLDAGCPSDAGVFAPKAQSASTVWVYFFSPEASEIAKEILLRPTLTVEACGEPDLTSLNQVPI